MQENIWTLCLGKISKFFKGAELFEIKWFSSVFVKSVVFEKTNCCRNIEK